MGSDSVFINGSSAHRVGDDTQHCGGMGWLIEGSNNVFIGKPNTPFCLGCMIEAAISGVALINFDSNSGFGSVF